MSWYLGHCFYCEDLHPTRLDEPVCSCCKEVRLMDIEVPKELDLPLQLFRSAVNQISTQLFLTNKDK